MNTESNFPVYPGWETVRLIGHGSFGAVYEIQRTLFGKVEKAALKQISIPQDQGDVEELYSTGYDDASITAHYESYLADIVREYQLMAEMKGHTNVVNCDDIRYVQKDTGIGWDIYIKMELLTPMMKSLDRMADEKQVIKLGRDMASALVLCGGEDQRRHQDRYLQLHGAGGVQQPALRPRGGHLLSGHGDVLAAQ